jgi:phage-related protein
LPKTTVVFYRDEGGSIPFLIWIRTLPEGARDACRARLLLLRYEGHTLRRPAAGYIGGGIWDLRAKSNRVQYRVLYFFHGQQAVVVSHGFMKHAARVPQREIDLAVRRKLRYEANPQEHTHEGWYGSEA